MLKRQEKEQLVTELQETVGQAHSMLVADYSGCQTEALPKLRRSGLDQGVSCRIVRNTIAKRAITDTPFACLDSSLKGPVMLVFSLDDPCAAARIVYDFMKDKAHDKFEVTALSLGDQVLGADQLKVIASMPTKEQAVAMVMGAISGVPASLARTVNEVMSRMARTIAMIAENQSATVTN